MAAGAADSLAADDGSERPAAPDSHSSNEVRVRARTSCRTSKAGFTTRTGRSIWSSATSTATGKKPSSSRPGRRIRSPRAPSIRSSPPCSCRVVRVGCTGSVCRSDFGKQVVTWTITANGKMEKAYGELMPVEEITERIVMTRGNLNPGEGDPNKPPVVTIDQVRDVTVAQPLTIVAGVTDDGLPKPRARDSAHEHGRCGADSAADQFVGDGAAARADDVLDAVARPGEGRPRGRRPGAAAGWEGVARRAIQPAREPTFFARRRTMAPCRRRRT